MINDLMEDFGYDSSRFEIAWVSSAEPDKFAAAVTKMTNRIKQLGPINSQDAELA
ncbi:Methyl-viologen-reducing hydrogenase, delta subunit [Desulfopila aestuarii DSM 18488]|uniref:Methyl-viologen-reducing hydrogenase, delta subunit n=3 Tax=Desulfopila aestuarii TaxID=231440 RepID=A0A1M7Y4Z9_9BACT|nr:Methyl-viologen-reducing hydrogenase, delta subunit [Desulfopila aestuarii DSM 18488]